MIFRQCCTAHPLALRHYISQTTCQSEKYALEPSASIPLQAFNEAWISKLHILYQKIENDGDENIFNNDPDSASIYNRDVLWDTCGCLMSFGRYGVCWPCSLYSNGVPALSANCIWPYIQVWHVKNSGTNQICKISSRGYNQWDLWTSGRRHGLFRILLYCRCRVE